MSGWVLALAVLCLLGSHSAARQLGSQQDSEENHQHELHGEGHIRGRSLAQERWSQDEAYRRAERKDNVQYIRYDRGRERDQTQYGRQQDRDVAPGQDRGSSYDHVTRTYGDAGYNHRHDQQYNGGHFDRFNDGYSSGRSDGHTEQYNDGSNVHEDRQYIQYGHAYNGRDNEQYNNQYSDNNQYSQQHSDRDGQRYNDRDVDRVRQDREVPSWRDEQQQSYRQQYQQGLSQHDQERVRYDGGQRVRDEGWRRFQDQGVHTHSHGSSAHKDAPAGTTVSAEASEPCGFPHPSHEQKQELNHTLTAAHQWWVSHEAEVQSWLGEQTSSATEWYNQHKPIWMPNPMDISRTYRDAARRDGGSSSWQHAYIDVYFFVFYYYSESEDLNYGKVPESSVEEQIRQLNVAYESVGVSFVLKGTKYVSVSLEAFMYCTDDPSVQEAVGKHRKGGPTVLHVYVKRLHCGTNEDGTLKTSYNGVAYLPMSYEDVSHLDGVYLAPFRLPEVEGDYKGSTGVHEAGHWLGLYHTFEGSKEGNSEIDGCEDPTGDEVNDTPAQKEPSYQEDCNPSQYPDTCPNLDGYDMFWNWMDYGECRNTFTSGQVARMRTMWEYRMELQHSVVP